MPAAIGTGRVIDKDLVLSGYKVPKGVKYFIRQLSKPKLNDNFL